MPPTKKITSKEIEPVSSPAPKGKYFYADGKRKTSVAKVKLYKGTGEFTINNKPINEYISIKTLIGLIKFPLRLTGNEKKFDAIIEASGGGINSQAEAIRSGITKALISADPLTKPTLKKAGLLTRDSRIKERKKYGLKRARRGPQFSKR